MNKNYKNNIDTEKLTLAAIRGQEFEDSGLPDTTKNRELFRMVKAEVSKMMRGGADVSIE